MFGFQPPALRTDIHDRGIRRIVDEQFARDEPAQRRSEPFSLLVIQVAAAESMAVDASRGAQHSGQQSLFGHFEREDCDRLSRLFRRTGGHVLGDIQRHGGLAHRRARRYDDQLGWVQACRQLVKFQKRRRKPPQPLSGVQEGFAAAGETIDDLRGVSQARAQVGVADLHHSGFRGGDQVLGFLASFNALRDDVLGRED